MRIDIALSVGAAAIALLIYRLADTIVLWAYPHIF